MRKPHEQQPTTKPPESPQPEPQDASEPQGHQVILPDLTEQIATIEAHFARLASSPREKPSEGQERATESYSDPAPEYEITIYRDGKRIMPRGIYEER